MFIFLHDSDVITFLEDEKRESIPIDDGGYNRQFKNKRRQSLNTFK